MGSTNERNFDWFNDAHWSASAHNIAQYAKTARVGKLKGILFDGEYYDGATFDYRAQHQRWNSGKSFLEYQAQVRARGASFMRAIQSECPDCTLFTMSLLSGVKGMFFDRPSRALVQERLEPDAYGLWPAFVNGLLDAAQPKTTIVDGNEPAYYYYRDFMYTNTAPLLKDDALVMVEPLNAGRYADNVQIGHAIYLDLVLDLFDPASPACPGWCGERMPHFLTADDCLRLLEHNVYHALRTADEYVWVYGEQMSWWSDRVAWWGGSIPAGTETTLRAARAKIAAGAALGFELDSRVDAALKACRVKTGRDCG